MNERIDRTASAAAAVGRARATAGPHPAILLFTIASVQDFVAAARRTIDLWFGSYLFSYLMFRAMQRVSRETGHDVFLLPTLAGQPLLNPGTADEAQLSVANIPNIFTALLPGERVTDFARAAENELLKARDEIFDAVRTKLEERDRALADDETWASLWKEQRDAFLASNIFWATVPIDTNENGTLAYREAAERAGTLLTARKTLRDFPQAEQRGEKCTLCGIRSALHRHRRDRYREVREFWDELAHKGNHQAGDGTETKLVGRIRKGERLCAVCLTRRLTLQYHFNDNNAAIDKPKFDRHMFPSTATVAAAPYARRVLDEAVKNGELRRHAHDFADLARHFLANRFFGSAGVPAVKRLGHGGSFVRLDGQWLFKDAWDERAVDVELDGHVTADEDHRPTREAVTSAHTTLRQATKDAGIVDPTPYYAIVAVDGDKMGDIVNGDRVKDGALTPEFHAQLALALQDFALNRVLPAVENEQGLGKLVYAGGDDVLALLPVESALRVVERLRGAFREALQPLDLRDPAELSAAVVFVHHSHPLAHAVEEAHHLLKHGAKKTYDRGAVAFRILKRSGEWLTTGVKWEIQGPALTTPHSMASLLGELANDIGNRWLSPSLSHDLRREGATVHTLAPDVQQKLLKHVLSRRRDGGAGGETPDQDAKRAAVKQAKGRALSLLMLLQGIQGPWSREEPPWLQAAHLLEVARFIGTKGGD